ncbi:MAG: 1-(5-phosphoribosyl)-5-[(5-phosphoribosylamino)methylideneamino]imidazole-4-carboxamide isomerase [Woeseiaceae bacterium]|nr:1-(5-phosphoribosyl)-5-[(5-phosphoribosylamino)methylideneamino]imidazole-4-carboxamide isomerase [Woeseiaceae bacterium]
MNIIPAIDLKDGKCVRLFKGDFDQTTEYSDDPVGVARAFSAFNVKYLHVVDLDGARTGTQSNFDIVRAITETTPLSVQLGGGIRNRETLDSWLASGVTRCVVGSVAVTDPDEVRAWIADVGAERVVLALDVRIENGEPFITTHGWTRSSELTLWSCIDSYLDAGLSHVLCTDVSRDGAMAGPNIELYREVLERYPGLKLQASGGVRSIDDMQRLREAGLPAAISGKAILDGNINAEEISTFQQNA